MKVRFGIAGELTLERARGGGDMTDWSKKMADKLKKRSQGQNLKDEKFLETQRMKREVGPRLWEAVRSDVSAEGIALNTEMGREIITTDKTSSHDEIVLVAHTDSGVNRSYIRFEPELGKLTWETTKGYKDTFELAIGSDSKMAFYNGAVPYSSGSIAKQILETLLD